MILRTLFAIALAGATLAAATAVVATVSTDAEAVQCRMINIGTPDKPRWVKDPGCSSGR